MTKPQLQYKQLCLQGGLIKGEKTNEINFENCSA